MAKVRVRWRAQQDHEAVFEIEDETYTGSAEQEAALLDKITTEAPTGTLVDESVEIEEVETLRKGTEVPADIKAPAYEPEF